MANLVIDTISSTDTTASFNVVNFGSARTVEVALSLNGTNVYHSTPYIGQFRNMQFTVTGLSPGTTYTIQAVAGSDNVTKTVTTTGTPGTLVTISISGAMRVAKNVSRTVVGVVRIAKTSSTAVTGAVRVAKNISKTITGGVDVEKSIPKVITGAVSISSPSYTDITGCVNIEKHEEVVGHSDIAGRVRIRKYVSKTITGRARIIRLDTSDIQGGVNIFKSQTAEISGSVRILGDRSSYITGRVRIRIAVPEKLPEDWEYSGTTEPEEWEKIDKASTDWSEVEKSDENWSEVEKDATSWTDSDVAGAEEWNYPLEDTG
jgi:hypothetical protein